MAFGIYVHIPYCLQICAYCDFTKYEIGKTLPPEQYAELLFREIQGRAPEIERLAASSKGDGIDTLYFGGGTPSLVDPALILSVKDELAKVGFPLRKGTEFTIEIDPATVDEEKLNRYLATGVTRFSVGAQTFNDRLLKIAGRKHSAQDTVELLSLLKRYQVNYSFDLLFALPTQTTKELEADLATALTFEPSHLSAYCLTVPEGHRLNVGRAPEEEQAEMFGVIERTLAGKGIFRYEISNFAKPGCESRHNLLYWTDQPYWGIGTSSHSYLPAHGKWGTRFWNSPSIKGYAKELDTAGSFEQLPEEQIERLEKHQSLTDFCHTSLRLMRGMDRNALRLKFGAEALARVDEIMKNLIRAGWCATTESGWTMTDRGRLVANAVFEKLTFLRGETGPSAD